MIDTGQVITISDFKLRQESYDIRPAWKKHKKINGIEDVKLNPQSNSHLDFENIFATSE